MHQPFNHLNLRPLSDTDLIKFPSVYHKLVMVRSRVSLCNNWCIFWLSETTKTLLGFALYTQGILFWTDAFQKVYKWGRDRQRHIWDYYNMFLRKFAFRKHLRSTRWPSLSSRPWKLLFWRFSLPSTLRRHVEGTEFESGLVRHLFFRTYFVRNGNWVAFTTAQLWWQDSRPFTGQPE